MVFSTLEKILLAKLGVDVVRNPISRKAAVQAARLAARMVAPVTVPAAAALGPVLPVALGAGLGYAALQTDPGQQLLEAAAERGRQDRVRFEQAKEFLREAALMQPPLRILLLVQTLLCPGVPVPLLLPITVALGLFGGLHILNPLRVLPEVQDPMRLLRVRLQEQPFELLTGLLELRLFEI